MGDLSELAKEYKGSGFRIIGLSADAMPENPDMVLSSKEMFESAGGNFTNIIASQSVIKTMLQGVNTVPTTKFYDSEGRLITDENEKMAGFFTGLADKIISEHGIGSNKR